MAKIEHARIEIRLTLSVCDVRLLRRSCVRWMEHIGNATSGTTITASLADLVRENLDWKIAGLDDPHKLGVSVTDTEVSRR